MDPREQSCRRSFAARMGTYYIKRRFDRRWWIGFDDRWYGPYEGLEAAKRVAVGSAERSGTFHLSTQVIVCRDDGTEEVVWKVLAA